MRALPRSLGLVCVLLAGCYSYTPLQTLEPVPQARVALVLSDQGRVGAGPNIGAGVARVEGALVGSTDSDYTLATRTSGASHDRARTCWWVRSVRDSSRSPSRAICSASAARFPRTIRPEAAAVNNESRPPPS